MNRYELEKLINKPRAFRHAHVAENIPVRQTMIILGSEVVSNRSTPKNYKIFKKMQKKGQITV
jgi:hypothetical protein